MIQVSEEEAQSTAKEGRRTILTQLAFLSWFLSVLPSGLDGLDSDDKKLVASFRLSERAKRGTLFKLARDYHEVNFPHFLQHGVGCHYIWADEEKASGRFVRYSPEFWEEYQSLRTVTGGSGPLDLTALPSYERWKDDIGRYDVFFQDRLAGRPGEIITNFLPGYDYRIIDFLYFGARVLENWNVLRAYSELFRAKNPIEQEQPAETSMRARKEERQSKLSDFATREIGRGSEEEAFFESPAIVREQVKNRYAPRVDRYFNTFNGRGVRPGDRITDAPLRKGVMSPTRRSEKTEDLGLTSRWVDRMEEAGHGHRRDNRRGRSFRSPSFSPRRRSSRSASPIRSNRYSSYEARERGRSLSCERSENEGSQSTFDDEYRSPPSPHPREDWYWALLWLDKSYLVLNDPRAAIYLKTLAACNEIMDMVGVLNHAIRFGIQFGLYVKASEVREFRDRNMTDLEKNTLAALYAPGYVDECIPYTIGGAAAYGKYLATIRNLLSRPHATAFIQAGGILSFIATFYDPDLIRRLMQGPSMQVTQYNRGDTVLLRDDDGDVFLVGDCVSPSEIAMLIGQVPTGNSGTETSLWPHPSLLERESAHAHGIWTAGLYKIFENLRADITAGHYRWRSQREWKSYFHAGNKGTFAPVHTPTTEDFMRGADMIRCSFPANWHMRPTLSISMPERFETFTAIRS
ncbi:hypothetical protein C8R47DRAFT_975243 [Mycena vitilis]|nr:hypothetical protein C8R47DRAFT_975243 [Mycena vitilis]